MIRNVSEYRITCDRSGEDGITCHRWSAPTADQAEQAVRENGWTSGDGYHECPRHQPTPEATRAG
ncbi:hypothetical protein BBK14_11325 [Parafrankia soli]|uniref:Uncharacterized protein n=1 Tax=Parafrankia soli TaxID=2599596 RepID=A0A1S1R9M5_9ACTN|nr:hypothetical protein [Parafrankia soli]OHV42205.1 hypothetical protein BBK14_11325 [Parafrankia soli]